MIELRNFSKSYGKNIAVQNVSFVVPSASISALAGLNGAGKTTILKAINGTHFADSGAVFINGYDVTKNTLETKQKIGFVSEQGVFFNDFTVLEYIDFHANIRLVTKDFQFILERKNYVIESFSLFDVLSKKIKTLSKGYKQRLSFAVALIGDPEVLLLDEPTSGLDPRQIVDMRKLITHFGKTKTILISTHIMQEIETLCSHIFILHKGNIIAKGTEKDICTLSNTKNIEEAFLYLTKKDVLL